MSLVISKVFTYDTDAGNYIQAVEGPAGDNQALEPAVRQAINNFVIGCKQDGIWSAIKASCILAGARTLSGALVPLSGTAPTNNNFVSGDYNRKTGLKGDASVKAIGSEYVVPAGNKDNAHGSTYVTEAMSTYNRILFGVSTGSDFGAFPETANRYYSACNNSAVALDVTNVGATTGLIGVSRSSSSSYLFRVGVSTQTISAASTTPSLNKVRIFSGATTFYSNPRIAFYSIGESLDLAKLDARVTALITAFGAAIP